jgi:nucleotide sugar dehydrogenase
MLPRSFEDRSVCIVGLGYVGLTLAVVMAEVGFTVHGVEINPEVVDSITRGEPHFSEKGLRARLSAQIAAGRITASTDWPAPEGIRVYIVTVGTPLGPDGKTNLAAMTNVAEAIGRQLKDGDLVILRSTVKVGVTNGLVRPILAASGKSADLAFCPERTVEGRALEELRTLPQIVGGGDEDATVRAAQLFSLITPTVVRVRDLETAEMIKLINNTQRDLMFAFANEVAGICDDIGVSVAEVVRAGNMGYQRASMPLPGPVGGPCLEKDPYILAESTLDPEGIARLALLGRRVNEELPFRAMKQIQRLGTPEPVSKIAIFGLAFKGRPETSDLRGTLAVKLIADAAAAFPGAQIVGFDPAVPVGDIETLGIAGVATAEEAAADADLLLFQNNNPQFEQLDLDDLAARMRTGGLIYDFWNQFDRSSIRGANGVRYCAFGSLCLS